MKLLRKLRALFRRQKLDAEMAEEMRAHLEMQAEQNRSQGMSAEEAHYAARRQFGGVEQQKEIARAQRSGVWLEQWAQDWRYAWRQITRTPGFSAIAIVTLALGIGLVTLQFSLVYGVSFTGPNVAGANRLISVSTTTAEGRDAITSSRHYLELRAGQTSFDQLAAFSAEEMVLSGGAALPRSRRGAHVTAEIFSIAGTRPAMGRPLRPDDNGPTAPRVVVLGWSVWQNDFSGVPDIIGRAVRMNGEAATVVGVMPMGFAFPVAEEIWTNLQLPANAESATWYDMVEIVGRLRPGVPLAQARSEVEMLMRRIAASAPEKGAIGKRAVVQSFVTYRIGSAFEMILWTLFTMAGLVLVLGCVNIANLLYARALRQRHELAVRAALGASRGRLLRQMVCLSSLLAGLGAMGGIAVAAWTAPWLNPLLSNPRTPHWIKVEADWHVLAAAVAVTGIVGVIAGLVPALRALRVDPNAVLHQGGRAPTSIVGRAGRGLVTVQIALAAAVLMVGAVLTRGVRSAGRDQIPPDAERVLLARKLSSPAASSETPASAAATLLPNLMERMTRFPGVERVAAVGRGLPTPILLEGMDPAEKARNGQFPSEAVSTDYFAVFGMQPSRGRGFTVEEIAGRAAVVMINESAARRFWPERNPIGQRVRFESREGLGDWHTIIGVVPDLPMEGNRRGLHTPGLYYPIDLTNAWSASLVVRTAADPSALVLPTRRALHELAPDRVFTAVTPMTEAVSGELRILRLLGRLALIFGASGMFLAVLGIFGVQAFFVESRRHEFGVRIALGARPAQIVGPVMRRGLVQLAIGLAAGLAGGWGLNRLLQATPLLRAVTQIDASVVFVVGSGLGVAVLLACWLPARRAAKVDPIVALRAE
jgi:putative ABC transport system permease protein